MFTLLRIFGIVPVGGLQPNEVQVSGMWSCPGGASSNIPLELRFVTPGAPMGTFTATTHNGANGPVGSVLFKIQGWSGLTCGAKLEFEVRGFCGAAWTAWETGFSSIVDCLDCPRIQISPPSLGPCSGNPPAQTVTLDATVMLA